MAAIYKHIIQVLIAIVMLILPLSLAQSDENTPYLPSIPKAESGQCVAPPDFMRKNHMNFLAHDRDLKVQKGETDIEYSLKECVACHTVRDGVGSPVSYDSPDHFCRSCHDYAAVKIDCFSCHNSKPDEGAPPLGENPHKENVLIERPKRSLINNWLKGKSDD